jgi:hypothetical protein
MIASLVGIWFLLSILADRGRHRGLDGLEPISIRRKNMKIAIGEQKRIRTLRPIQWQNYGVPLQTLPAGWEGNITRYRPGAATALLEDGRMFAIVDCFLEDGSIEEVQEQNQP